MKNYARFYPYILAFFASATYIISAPSFMLWLDAPRFVAAIVSLGVPNPPEPLYIMLAKPFSLIPFGSYIFRIQIFSAVTAFFTLILLYKLIFFQVKNTVAALFGVAALAFSYQFWSQSQNVETFILVVLIEVLVLYLLFKSETKRTFFINMSIIAALMGLATGTNPTIGSIIPSILYVMWLRRKFFSVPAFFVWVFIGITGIVLIHLYIPIRAAANPFLNYWRATTLENVWAVSTGAGLNVYVPEIGRVNGFTLSPEIFFKSLWHYIEVWLIKFTPLLLPFMIAGSVYLWKKVRSLFIFYFLIIGTNILFACLYFSGNQESWFLISDVAWVVMASFGYFWLVTEGEQSLKSIKYLKFLSLPKLFKYKKYFFLIALIPFIIWLPFLYRRDWVLTEDYIKNLYRPIGEEKAILFGSSDLYDSVSFYVHDIPGTTVFKPNVIPITDNLLYILSWYRENLKSTTDLKIPDDTGLKYDSAAEYSQYVMEFFSQNLPNYRIFVTIPALRNNFLQAYRGQNLGPSLRIDETRFKLVPQGMLMEVVPLESTASSNLTFFDYEFQNKDFPKKKPFLLEQTYKGELVGVLNEYAYSLENLGDGLLREGKAEEAFKYYQKAYEFNPKNAEIISRLGNYYGTVGNHQKAAEYFEKALKIEPNNVGLLFNAAIAYENSGKIDKAIKNYNKVIQTSKEADAQIKQLAQVRLAGIRQATPSAEFASESAALGTDPNNIQKQLLQISDTEGIYESKKLGISFLNPPGFKVTEETNRVIRLSNSQVGIDELTFLFFTKVMGANEDLESLGENLPFELGGPILITQPVNLPGFEAIGKTIGTGEHLTFLLLMKKEKLGITVKVYPGDTNKSVEFNQILQSIKIL